MQDEASPASTARAMERVLRAEHEAQTRLAEAGAEAQALVELARGQALARVNRTLERIARWQRGHAQMLEQRLTALQAQAEAAAQAQPVLGVPQIQAAVERVAAQLTGATPGTGR